MVKVSFTWERPGVDDGGDEGEETLDILASANYDADGFGVVLRFHAEACGIPADRIDRAAAKGAETGVNPYGDGSGGFEVTPYIGGDWS